ncbi:MAG: helix-turn-helix domain-containing protein [Candidatus Thorarchaeota archaeon]
MKSRLKDIRKELGLNQQDLAESIGVTRQTIYFLEKGEYNPSLTKAFMIAEVLNKPLNEIFYQEPLVKEIIEKKTLKELKEFANEVEILYEILERIGEMNDDELTKNFTREQLEEISEFLEMEFDDLFIDA